MYCCCIHCCLGTADAPHTVPMIFTTTRLSRRSPPRTLISLSRCRVTVTTCNDHDLYCPRTASIKVCKQMTSVVLKHRPKIIANHELTLKGTLTKP